MKRTLFVTVMLVAFALCPRAVAAQDQADNQVIPFTAVEISCSETPGTEMTEGDITRHSGQIEPIVWFSTTPLAVSRSVDVIDWQYYATSDQGLYTGTLHMEPAGMAGAIVGGFSGYWDANGGEFVGYGIGDGELTGVEMYITGGPMTVDIAMALIKDDPRVVDGNPCYPDPMPDVGEAALVYGYFLDRRVEVKTGFADVNGAKLYYETAGEGDPVIMIHGYGGDRRDWDYLFRPLAAQHQVVRYDLRGFGKSDRPTTEPYSHVEDLKTLMEILGIEKSHLIGQSFGSGIGLEFAIAHPERTRSLVMSGPDVPGTADLPYTPEEQKDVDAFNAAFETALAAEDWQAAAEAVLLLPEFTTSAKHPTAGARLVDMVKDFEWWQMFREDPVIVPETPAVEELDKVTAPVLVITGELAPSTDRARADIVEKGVAGAKKVVLPGVDHLAQLETPAVFEALVREFLEGVRQ